jgi:hypothetical protein
MALASIILEDSPHEPFLSHHLVETLVPKLLKYVKIRQAETLGFARKK